jgi:hypothetical protein
MDPRTYLNVLDISQSELLAHIKSAYLSPVGEDTLGELDDAVPKIGCGPLIRSSFTSTHTASLKDFCTDEPRIGIQHHQISKQSSIPGEWSVI